MARQSGEEKRQGETTKRSKTNQNHRKQQSEAGKPCSEQRSDGKRNEEAKQRSKARSEAARRVARRNDEDDAAETKGMTCVDSLDASYKNASEVPLSQKMMHAPTKVLEEWSTAADY